MRKLRFVKDRPKEGTLTFGVVYHVTREYEINQFVKSVGVEPIGWVVEDEPHEEDGQLVLPMGLPVILDEE